MHGSHSLALNGGWGRWRRTVTLFMVVALGLVLAGCGDERGEATTVDGEPREPYVIVASIYPLADLATQVAGTGFEVHTLLPPGATPHGFELTADKMRLLAEADLVLAVGLNLDPWAGRAAHRIADGLPVLKMADMVDPASIEMVSGELIKLEPDPHHDHEHHEHHEHDHHAHDHGGVDHHLWIDPVLVKQWVRSLRGELVERFPEHADEVDRNTAAVMMSLDQLDREFREQLAAVSKKELVTFHNAFDRLAERYGLKVVAHLTEVELDHGEEIRPGRWREAVAAVQRYDLAVIYSEPQFAGRGLSSLRREAGVEVLQLDPIGHPRREGVRTYQEMMRSNLATLVDGQSRSR